MDHDLMDVDERVKLEENRVVAVSVGRLTGTQPSPSKKPNLKCQPATCTIRREVNC